MSIIFIFPENIRDKLGISQNDVQPLPYMKIRESNKATSVNQVNGQGLNKFMLRRSEFEGILLKMIRIL